jgi:hypothetical protein
MTNNGSSVDCPRIEAQLLYCRIFSDESILFKQRLYIDTNIFQVVSNNVIGRVLTSLLSQL